MNLPKPGHAYDARNEAETRTELERQDKRNRKTNADVEIGGQKLILTSPDGTRWSITVANDGTLSATAL
jgi:hypothetical protein